MTGKVLMACKVLLVLCAVGLPLCVVSYVPAKRTVTSTGLPLGAVIAAVIVL
jgi:hypothetical protein